MSDHLFSDVSHILIMFLYSVKNVNPPLFKAAWLLSHLINIYFFINLLLSATFTVSFDIPALINFFHFAWSICGSWGGGEKVTATLVSLPISNNLSNLVLKATIDPSSFSFSSSFRCIKHSYFFSRPMIFKVWSAGLRNTWGSCCLTDNKSVCVCVGFNNAKSGTKVPRLGVIEKKWLLSYTTENWSGRRLWNTAAYPEESFFSYRGAAVKRLWEKMLSRWSLLEPEKTKQKT